MTDNYSRAANLDDLPEADRLEAFKMLFETKRPEVLKELALEVYYLPEADRLEAFKPMI